MKISKCEDESVHNERMIRYEWHRQRMLYRAGLPCKFEHMGEWHKYCKHEESPRRKKMNYLILRSPFLPYNDQIISQHLSRTQRWMRKPCRSSFYHGIGVIKKVKISLYHFFISYVVQVTSEFR